MRGTSSFDRPTEALARAQQHWQQRRQEAAGSSSRALTVALSRAAGTPGTSIAREVGARLGWPVYDHELVELIARDLGLRASLLKSVDERPQGWLQESVLAFGSGPYPSEGTYVRSLTDTLLSLGAHGQCVIVGRGAALLLPRDRTLRVRLVAPLEDRVAAVVRDRHLRTDEAARWVEQTDADRTRFIREHFRKDPTDPAHFDLVLNTSRWQVAACADLIVQAVGRMG